MNKIKKEYLVNVDMRWFLKNVSRSWQIKNNIQYK